MADSPIDVQYVADLARLKLTPEEIAQFQKQLGDILGYVDLLQKADVSGIQAEMQTSDLVNSLRADVETPSLPVREALANAPRQANDLIQVPKIVE